MMSFGLGGGLGSLGWGISMFLSMLLPLVLLIGAIYLALKLWDGGRKTVVTSGPEPVTILKQRYARGEINKEEFDQLKRDINQEM